MITYGVFRTIRGLGLISLGTLLGAPAFAAREPQVAGYCWVTDLTSRGRTAYHSSTFQKDSAYFDRDDWATDFRAYLRGKGVEAQFSACRVWKGGADALEAANAAKAIRPSDIAETFDVDWAPEDTLGGPNSRRGEASSAASSPQANAPSKPTPALSKYVEVAGPDGKTVRLSPEVAARNQAAADEYRRKMEEFARSKAEHERKLAQHQQSQAAADAEMRTYEQKLAVNAAEVAAHAAAMAQHTAATKPASGAKGWMYCDARGAPGDKRRYYSRIAEVHYVPGESTIIDVMGRNRPAFKSYVAGTHSVYFATDSLLHCPYSTTSMGDAEALMARDKRGDGNSQIEVIQTGWLPAS